MGDGLYEGASHLRVRRVRRTRVRKPCVPVSHKTERYTHLQLEGDGLCCRRLDLRVGR